MTSEPVRLALPAGHTERSRLATTLTGAGLGFLLGGATGLTVCTLLPDDDTDPIDCVGILGGLALPVGAAAGYGVAGVDGGWAALGLGALWGGAAGLATVTAVSVVAGRGRDTFRFDESAAGALGGMAIGALVGWTTTRLVPRRSAR